METTTWTRQRGHDSPPVRRQDDGASLLDDAVDAVPQGAASFGVHAGGGLVL